MSIREQQILDAIRGVLLSLGDELKGYRVFLFGSRGRGLARPRSDFDVGVLGATPLPLKTYFKVDERLDAVDTLYRIDWVDLTSASDEFRAQALRKAVLLYG